MDRLDIAWIGQDVKKTRSQEVKKSWSQGPLDRLDIAWIGQVVKKTRSQTDKKVKKPRTQRFVLDRLDIAWIGQDVKKTRSQEVKKSWSQEVRVLLTLSSSARTLQFSTSVEVRLVIVRWSVGWLVS